MSKKEREICKFKIDLMNLFVCPPSNDNIISAYRPGLKMGVDISGLV